MAVWLSCSMQITKWFDYRIRYNRPKRFHETSAWDGLGSMAFLRFGHYIRWIFLWIDSEPWFPRFTNVPGQFWEIITLKVNHVNTWHTWFLCILQQCGQSNMHTKIRSACLCLKIEIDTRWRSSNGWKCAWKCCLPRAAMFIQAMMCQLTVA